MAINITIKNSTINGGAEFGNRNQGNNNKEDIRVLIDDTSVEKDLSFFNDNTFADAVSQAMEQLSDSQESDEYKSLEKMSSKGIFSLDDIKNHLFSFASGTLASILANLIIK